MVSFRPFYLAFVLGAGLVMLSACEDPSAVGLDLVGTEGGIPAVQRVDFNTFEVAPLDGIIENATVMLAGDVDDPLVGQTNAVGYIDFLGNSVLSTAYREGPVTGLLLHLETASVYGDSASTVTFALHEVLSEFEATPISADELPPVGPEIMQFSMKANDESVEVALPESFFADRDSTFRSLTFAVSFHGFQLRPVSGNAIVGFYDTITSQSNLKGIVGTDTVTFLATKGISSSYTRAAPVALPAGLIALQQGIGPQLSFDFDIDAFEGNSINRAALQLSLDTLLVENDPAGFVRPPLESMTLHGVLPDSTSILLALGALRDDGITMDFDAPSFRQSIQSILQGADPFDHFEVRFLTSSGNTLNTVVVHDTTSTTRPPLLYVTSTPLN